MNRLPFGLSVKKEPEPKKTEVQSESTMKYEQKLAEYRDTLESYKKGILEYLGRLDDYDKLSLDNQISIVQSALDLRNLKEQGDKTMELIDDMRTGKLNKALTQLEDLMATIVETNYKLEGMDKNVVSRLSDLVLELQKQTLYQNKQQQAETVANLDKLSKTVKSSKPMLWLLIALNLIGLGGVTFLILYMLEIISF